MSGPAESRCDHKFVDSKHCLKCGWIPPTEKPAWLPTAEAINSLPDRVRQYIHDLETRADPSGEVRELTICRDTCRNLEMAFQEARAIDAILPTQPDRATILAALEGRLISDEEKEWVADWVVANCGGGGVGKMPSAEIVKRRLEDDWILEAEQRDWPDVDSTFGWGWIARWVLAHFRDYSAGGWEGAPR